MKAENENRKGKSKVKSQKKKDRRMTAGENWSVRVLANRKKTTQPNNKTHKKF